jgi:rhodanese-related sulfurtransferase
MTGKSFWHAIPLVLGWITLIAFFGVIQAGGQTAGKPGPHPVPAEKQTTPGLYLSAKEAYAMWKASPRTVKIVDVRTPEEVLFVGHPAMAWNVPVSFQSFDWDSVKRHFPMKSNPNFVPQIAKLAAPGDTLLVMCRSGSRSAGAVNQLAKAGFTHVYNIVDGMEGDMVADSGSVYLGQRMKNGWKNSGLPWTYDADPRKMTLPPDR